MEDIKQDKISDDEELLISELFEKLKKRMYDIALKKLNSEFDAEDILDEAFLAITGKVKKIYGLDPDVRNAYCFKTLNSKIIDFIRRPRKTISMGIDRIDYFKNIKSINDNLNMEEQDIIVFFEESEILNENIDKLNMYMDKLSKEERLIIHLRFIKKKKFKEIAKIIGITEDNAKKKNNRAIKKLEKHFERGDENAKNK